jgi:hypothetical protein
MFDYQIVCRFEVYHKNCRRNLPDHEQILFHQILKLQAIYSAKFFFIIGNELICCPTDEGEMIGLISEECACNKLVIRSWVNRN